MVSDKSGRRIFLALIGRIRPADADVGDAKAQYIRDAAAKLRKPSPPNVYAQIRHRQGRHDITMAEVRQALHRQRKSSR